MTDKDAVSRGAIAWIRLLFQVVLVSVFLAGCSPYGNEPFRKKALVECTTVDACSENTYIERYGDYDLAYVEFTERGNAFSRERMQRVLDYVTRRAGFDPEDPTKRDRTRSVTAVVFVHGWKHNARKDDNNVKNFRKLLRNASLLQTGNRRVVGIYIGWRGLSVDTPLVKELSYWDRKAVAQQVGKGGVTELLLRLEKAVVDNEEPNRNIYLVTGHSFGGAIVLSALNEVLLERIVDAKQANEPEGPCLRTRPFGHGVVLLNPAIEANEALQLKERVAELSRHENFCFSQDRLMHVISSYADAATDKAFRWGQRVGVNLTWRQTTLDRKLGAGAKPLELKESELDTTTVGNFAPFQTGRFQRASAEKWNYYSCIDKGKKKDCVCFGLDKNSSECEAALEEHIPVEHNEPLAFIRTDKKVITDKEDKFIADHNDVFNPAVSAYLATIIAEARHKRSLRQGLSTDVELPSKCRGDRKNFPFGSCFDFYFCQFRTANDGKFRECDG